MAFLGYDRELLTALRRAMRRSSEELAALGNPDHEAADAMRVVRASRSMLDDQWLPVLDGVLACSALDDRRPTLLDPHDIRAVMLLDRQRDGWQITTDPLPDTAASAAMSIEEARAIGAGLFDDALTGELTLDELCWLVGRLQAAAAAPAATVALREAVGGEDRWADLFDRLGLDRLDGADAAGRAPADRAIADRVAAIDAAFVPLAAIYASTPRVSKAAWYPTVIGQIHHYSAALLLTHLHLSPSVAAGAAHQVLSRWLDGYVDDQIWANRYAAGDNGADLLFRWLANDGEAARLFIERVSHRPELLFHTGRDDPAVTAVLVAGTDPGRVPVDQAGRAIQPLLRWAMEHELEMHPTIDTGVDNVRVVLAAALAPWLMQLTGRTDDWGWSAHSAESALRWVLQDDDAAERMLTSMQAWQQTLATTVLVDADGRLSITSINELAELFAKVHSALRDQEVSDAITATFWSSATFAVVQIVVSAFVPGGPAIGMAADATLSVLGPTTVGWLTEHGMGPPADATADAAKVRFGTRAADVQVMAVVAVVGQMIDRGLAPPDTLEALRLDDVDDGCTPEVVNDRINEFIAGLRDVTEPVTFNGLIGVANAFGNAQSVEAQC